MDNYLINLSKEVKLGLKNNKPIVALESTLISHGLPYPENIKVAYSSINAVKKSGSIPATIAVINGKIKVGLKEKDIVILAPIVHPQKGEHSTLIKDFAQQGFMRIRINEKIYRFYQKFKIDSKKKNNIEIVIDRIKSNQENRLRIIESLDTASNISNGIIYVMDMKKNTIDYVFSTKY